MKREAESKEIGEKNILGSSFRFEFLNKLI